MARRGACHSTRRTTHHRPAWPLAPALALWLVIALGGCASRPELKPKTEPDVSRRSPIVAHDRDRIDAAGRSYAVTRFTIDPASTVRVTTDGAIPPVSVVSVGSVASTGGGDPLLVTVAATPWRRATAGARAPVGIVVTGGRRISPPAPPYWALAFTGAHASTAYLLPQQSLTDGPSSRSDTTAHASPAPHTAPGTASPAPHTAPGTASPAPHTAVGGFYPLLHAGQPVAANYPGAGIRAARVAIAGFDEPDAALTIVTVAGTRLLRPGVTTGELANYLAQRGFDWAINLDGGRSAAVTLPDGTTFPRNVPFRRPGPIRLHFLW